MKKAKKILRNIAIFVLMMGVSILPTLTFRTKDEINAFFRLPEYWIISAFIAAIATLVYAVSNSKD